MVKKKQLKVLIVEDHNVSLILMKDLLADTNYACDLACNGNMAEKMLKKHKYDIILMDLLLPDINGVEIIKNFRSVNNETFVIAVTAFPKIEMEKACISAGFDEYISKPFNIEELYEKMELSQQKHI